MESTFDNSNRILLAVDSSNFEYYCMSLAFVNWTNEHPDDAKLYIKPVKKTDQDNLPNILVSRLFRRGLGWVVQNRLESIVRILKDRHQEDIDIADGIDVFFTEDDNIDGNFRKLKYPEYKANRKLVPSQFNKHVIKDYIHNVLFKELGLEEKFGYKFVRVPECESDDIIAVMMKRFTDYKCRVILSSDKDFLQLKDVYQYTMSGKRVERKIKSRLDSNLMLTPDEFRLWKIIRGDISDNIKSVFPGHGDVKSYRLIKDKPTLRQKLSESQESANRYLLNKSLIDFNSIPPDIEERIYKVLCEKMNELNIKKRANSFSLDGCIEL